VVLLPEKAERGYKDKKTESRWESGNLSGRGERFLIFETRKALCD